MDMWGFPGGASGKEPPGNAGVARDTGLIPGSGRLPWRRKWQPSPVFLPGESHGQRSLGGYSPQGCKESDMTKQLTLGAAENCMVQPTQGTEGE